MAKARFELGQLAATPGALAALAESGEEPGTFLARHASGDWGDLSEEDRQENEFSLTHGFRLLSAYTLHDGTKIWVITEQIGNDLTVAERVLNRGKLCTNTGVTSTVTTTNAAKTATASAASPWRATTTAGVLSSFARARSTKPSRSAGW
jgi:hypothetical protein